jgi:putative transposase
MGLMRDLGQSYVKYFNRQHGRSGTLWEGRYRSCIVESAQYVLACYRYIELNPVRAGMVDQPLAHSWSSHAANLGIATDVLAAPHSEYLALADSSLGRYAAYRLLFDEALSDSVVTAIREATNGSLPLSGESLKSELVAGGRKVEHQRPGPRPRQANDDEDSVQQKIVL